MRSVNCGIRSGACKSPSGLFSDMEHRGVAQRFDVRNPCQVPLSVDSEVYVPNGARSDEIIYSVGWLNGANAVRKGMPEIIRAAPFVRKARPNVRFVISGGKGSYYPELARLVKEVNAEDCVVFTDAVSKEEKIRWMQRCAMYLQPTRFEGFGLAILEAMSCGAPVVSCPAGAVPEVVGDTGVLVPSGSPEAVADAVIELLENRDKRKFLGEQARLRARNLFSFERRKEAIRVVLEGVL